MYPTIQIPDRHVASHLAMLALAVLVCHVLDPRLGQRLAGIRPRTVRSALVCLGLAVFAGGRAHFVWNAWPFARYTSHLLDILRFWEGLHARGAPVAMAVVAPIIPRTHRIGVAQFANALAPTVVIGPGVARIGCFLNGRYSESVRP